MKNILILLTVLLLPILAYAQSKSSFSSMEVNHVRVATPGLLRKAIIYICIWILCKSMNMLFPYREPKLFPLTELAEDIREQI